MYHNKPECTVKTLLVYAQGNKSFWLCSKCLIMIVFKKYFANLLFSDQIAKLLWTLLRDFVKMESPQVGWGGSCSLERKKYFFCASFCWCFCCWIKNEICHFSQLEFGRRWQTEDLPWELWESIPSSSWGVLQAKCAWVPLWQRCAELHEICWPEVERGGEPSQAIPRDRLWMPVCLCC